MPLIRMLNDAGSKVLSEFAVDGSLSEPIRGSQEIKIDPARLHAAGLNKISFGYGLGRYLRDGAPSSVKLSGPTGKDAKALSAIHADIDYDPKENSVTTPYRVKAKAISKLRESKIPGAKAMGDAADEALNVAAMVHAESRLDALYSGEIVEGRISATSPEVHKLRALIVNDFVKIAGVKVSKVPKMPGTVDSLKAFYLASEIPLPKKAGDLTARFGKLLAVAETQAKADRDALAGLEI